MPSRIGWMRRRQPGARIGCFSRRPVDEAVEVLGEVVVEVVARQLEHHGHGLVAFRLFLEKADPAPVARAAHAEVDDLKPLALRRRA